MYVVLPVSPDNFGFVCGRVVYFKIYSGCRHVLVYMRFGIRRAFSTDGSHVSASKCSKEDGPFTRIICCCALTPRDGSKAPAHFIHMKSNKQCPGNTDEHREIADRIFDSHEPGYLVDGSIPEVKNQEDEDAIGSIYETQPQKVSTGVTGGDAAEIIDKNHDLALESERRETKDGSTIEPRIEPPVEGSISDSDEIYHN